MAYTYRADVTMTVNVNVEAESYAVAEELIQQYLAPLSDNSKVSINSTDGIDFNYIESDDDPTEDTD